MPLIVNNKEVKKLIHDDSGLEVLEMKDSNGKLLHKRVNLEFMIDEFRPYTETIDTWGTLMDVPDDPILENTPTIYLVGWSYDGVNVLPEPLRVPIDDSTLYAIWSDALVNIFDLDIGTTVRLNSKSTDAVTIGSIVTLTNNFQKGIDARSGNINKYINTESTLISTSSNGVNLDNLVLSLKPYLLRGHDYSVGSLNLGTSMVYTLNTKQGTANTFNERLLIGLDEFTKGKDVSYDGSFEILSTNNLSYDSRMGISLNEVFRNNPLSMLRGHDFSVNLDSSNIGIESELYAIGDVGYILNSVTGLSVDEFVRGKDVNYSGEFNLMGESNVDYDYRLGISLSETIRNNPLSMLRGHDFSVNLDSSNIGIESELDTTIGGAHTLSTVTGPSLDKFTKGKDVNYSGIVNLLGEDLIELDSRVGTSLNEVMFNQSITYQKGDSVYVNLNPGVINDINLGTYLQNGVRFNLTVKPNVSNIDVSASGSQTATPSINYVTCVTGGYVQVSIKNNDSSPVAMDLSTGGSFYTVSSQVQPGASFIYTVITGHSGNYYYNNWRVRAKASDKLMSVSSSPISGSVTCPVSQLKWVYVPNHSGIGIPSFENPEGKVCSIENTYTSYYDPVRGEMWFRCTKV